MEEIFFLMNELINWVEIIDQIEILNKLHKKGRKVRFNPFDTIYIIENRDDIYSTFSYGELWWRNEDYIFFRYMATKNNKTKEDENILL
jgi:hypothetical protein